jgi:hypothetical protein
MSVEEIEAVIAQLSAEDLARFTAWFESYHERAWDKQIEADLEAGRLDAVLNEVDKEYESGLGKPL